MKLTKDECVMIYHALSNVKQPSFKDIKDFPNKERLIFHARFLNALAVNKRRLKPLVDELQETQELSDEYKEYLEKRRDVLIKYAKKDEDGNPIERTSMVNGQPQASYIIPNIADKNSKVNKELNKIENQFKDVINIRKKLEKELKDVLKEKVEIDLQTVSWKIVPDGLDPEVMDGISYIIEEEEEDSKTNK